jgi:DNA-binding CsgD family transcriptional regulator
MATRGRPRHPDILTPREWEVLGLIRQGLTNPQIADRLDITRAAVKYHVSEILSKLAVSTREDAAAWRPDRRPWWVAGLALISRPLTRISSSVALKTAGAALLLATAAGLSLLIWALVATDGTRTEGPAGNGDAIPVADAPPGRIAFTSFREDGEFNIYAIDADGSNIQSLTKDLDSSSSRGHMWPSWSPDGELIGFIASGRTYQLDTAASLTDNAEIFLMNGDGSNARQLTDMVESRLSAFSHPLLSPNGDRIAFGCRSKYPSKEGICIATMDGTVEVVRTGLDDSEHAPSAWSPDGRLLAIARIDDDSNRVSVVVFDPDEGGFSVLLDDPAFAADAVWSPDGGTIAFTCSESPLPTPPAPQAPLQPGICLAESDGSNVRRISDSGQTPSWSPDGRWIAFMRDGDIYVMRSDGSGARPIVLYEGIDVSPTWSPIP